MARMNEISNRLSMLDAARRKYQVDVSAIAASTRNEEEQHKAILEAHTMLTKTFDLFSSTAPDDIRYLLAKLDAIKQAIETEAPGHRLPVIEQILYGDDDGTP